MRKVWILSLLAAIIVSLSVFAFNLFGSESTKSDVTMLSEKIDTVLKNQEGIIAQLADIRQQLDIIRVRASAR
jgi:peptidoglycan hydrolase CwlO-like protein